VKKRRPGKEPDLPKDHARRVSSAFEDLDKRLPQPVSAEAREKIDGLREAVAAGDSTKARAHLSEVKQRHGWLYTELASHPEISALINELALWGF
jgi:hypothetical protein